MAELPFALPFADFAKAASGAALAFAVVGLLSFTILQVYVAMTTRRTDVTEAEDDTPQEPRPMSRLELARFVGDDGTPIYIGVKDPYSEETSIFDVSSGRDFYGPGGPYHVFAGKDATFGLATSSISVDTVTGDLSKLSQHQRDTHVQWYSKYSSKYPKVGYLVSNSASDQSEVQPAESKKDA